MARVFGFEEEYDNASSSLITGGTALGAPTLAEIYCCTSDNLPKSAKKHTVYFTTDTRNIYFGQGAGMPLKQINAGSIELDDGSIIDVSVFALKSEVVLEEELEDKVKAIIENSVQIPDLSDMVLRSEVNRALELKADKADTYTKLEIDNMISNVDVDLSEYVTNDILTDNYYTKQELNEIYATKDSVYTKQTVEDNFVKKEDALSRTEIIQIAEAEAEKIKDTIPDTSLFALKSDIPSLDEYAKKEDIPNVNEFITEQELNTAVNSLNVYSKSEVDNLISTNIGSSLNGYLTVENANNNYAKKSDIPDISNLATKDEIPNVDNLVNSNDLTNLLNDKMDKSNSYSKSEIDEKIAQVAAGGEISLDGYLKEETAEETYAKKSDIPDTTGFLTSTTAAITYALKSDIPDLSGYLNKVTADGYYASKSDIPNLEPYALKENVYDIQTADNTFVKKEDLDQKEGLSVTDVENMLNDYAKKEDIPEIPEIPDTSNFATKDEIPDTSQFVKQDQLPDTSNFATKDQIPNISNLATKQEIPDISGLAKIEDIPDTSNFVTNTDVDNSISDALQDYAKTEDIPDTSDLVDNNSLNNTLKDYVLKSEVQALIDAAIEEALKNYKPVEPPQEDDDPDNPYEWSVDYIVPMREFGFKVSDLTGKEPVSADDLIEGKYEFWFIDLCDANNQPNGALGKTYPDGLKMPIDGFDSDEDIEEYLAKINALKISNPGYVMVEDDDRISTTAKVIATNYIISVRKLK